MGLEIYKHRSGLPRTLQALKNGTVTIGFIGGSITDSREGNRWPEYVTSWFVEKFPHVRVCVENAAIGATGSDLAVFRAERDLINRNCDIVFIEYAVNDGDELPEKRMRTREGLIRKLLADGNRDLVIVYTYQQNMYSDMMNGKVPASISEFEELGEHYKIGSVWMALYALEEVKKGRMRWEEWLPDGLHPENRGSLSYAQSVVEYLEKELIASPSPMGIQAGGKLVKPLNAHNWERTELIPLEDIKTEGPWVIRRWANLEWIDRVLDTSAVGAKLSFHFEGRGLSLGFDFGNYSSEFRYRLDGKEWMEAARSRDWWCPDSNWFRIYNVADDLPDEIHHFELEVIHGNTEKCKGTNFRLGFAGVIK